MGYTENDSMVRVDFFKPSGKWYNTEAIKWDRYYSIDPKTGELEFPAQTLRRCLDEQLGNRLSEMIAVCLDPYCENSYPIMLMPRG
jgi:hypothetical protein